MNIIRQSEVIFAEESTEKEFHNLNEKDGLKKFIERAIRDMRANAFCGIQIPKKLFPKEYIKKYEIKNLWKYDLPDGWRLIYTITTPSRIEVLSVILEWFDHKEYEKRFGY